jgi:hypothetical protein
VPNGSLGADDALAVSFMAPEDAESYIKLLEKKGLAYLVEDEPADMVIADQIQGLKHDCLGATSLTLNSILTPKNR